jgi:VanZ family protein
MPENNTMFWQKFRPALIWALFVLILCGLPGKDFPELTFLQWLKPDKIAHLFLFGIQCFLLLKAFMKIKQTSVYYKNAVLFSLTLSISYGIIVEILQTYVFIQRDGDVRDAIANAIGAFLGVWLYKRMNRRKLLVLEKSQLN